MIMFPIIVRTADEVIHLVPSGLSEAALALGAPKWRTALRIVIPAALPGILTGIVLAVARAAGETAPLLFTAGYSNFFSTNVLQPMASMPIVIYNLDHQRTHPAIDPICLGGHAGVGGDDSGVKSDCAMGGTPRARNGALMSDGTPLEQAMPAESEPTTSVPTGPAGEPPHARRSPSADIPLLHPRV